MYFVIKTTRIAVLTLVSWALLAQTASKPLTCDPPDEYEEVLDAYFAHAHGTNFNAVILRVYGGNTAEYELVLDPGLSNHSITWYEPRQSLWVGAYDGLFTGIHRGLQSYNSRALKISLIRQEIGVPEAQFSDLVAKAAAIDLSACEHLPLKDSKGHSQMIFDAPWLELILHGGSTRVRVTDTSDFKDLVSQNPSLLAWANEVQNILRNHLRSTSR